MKRLLFALAAMLALLPSAAFAQSTESIASFDVRVRVQQSRMLTVTEDILYDFGQATRHGIYRDIPVRYERNGGTYQLSLTVDGVTMDGQSVPWQTSRSGDDLRIKIGDANKTVTGRHAYHVTYHTDRAINFFDGEGELYWNATGNGWEVPIRTASVTLTGPSGFDAAAARQACYTGTFGSTDSHCAFSSAGNQLTVRSDAPLEAGEGLTLVVRFPQGMIAEPTAWERIRQFIIDNGVLALPFVTLAFMLWWWNKKGRDPKGRGTVIPQYEAPRGLAPAEMIALKEQQVPARAVTATIIDLARRGYLKIDFDEQKGIFKPSQTYTFIERHGADARLSAAETEVYDGLFQKGDHAKLEDLKGSFYRRLPPFKEQTFASLRTRGFFERNPATVRTSYIAVGGGIIVGLFWLGAAFLTPVVIGAGVASGAIIAIIGWFMPRVTPEGAIALEEVEGFKWFLSVTEKDRLAFHDAPALKPQMFHALLPAAVAFGVETQWAEQFKGLDIPPPDYATGSVLNNWVALNFVHDIGRMNTAAAATAFAAPSSAGAGGSGFSGGGVGGGFGGGGGGSW